jgi:hypothetical protein
MPSILPTISFVADDDTALGYSGFKILVAKIEAEAEPDCVIDDIQSESREFVDDHAPMLSLSRG